MRSPIIMYGIDNIESNIYDEFISILDIAPTLYSLTRPKSLEDSQLINNIINIDIYFFIINRMLIHTHGFQYILLLTPLYIQQLHLHLHYIDLG